MQDSPTTAPRWILHPALIAAAFVLEVALSNKIEPAGFARALAVAILVGIGLTVIGWAIARDRWMGGIGATALIFATISMLPLFFAWQWLRGTLGPAMASAVLALVVLGVTAAPAIQRVRVRRGARMIRGPVTAALNRFAAVLLIIVVVLHVGPDLPGQLADVLSPQEKISIAPVSELPDIYVILLDAYPRADVLERKFGIDNSEFLDDLRALDFDVGTENHSNYAFTQLTLASLFQMRHLEDVNGLAPLIGVPGPKVNALRNAVIDSPAFATLRAAGYQIVAMQPGYEHAALRGVADRVLEHGEMNDLERDILERSWLLDPLGALIPTIVTGPRRDRVVHAFDDLAQLALESRSRPIFTWVHLPAPHLPLIMDARGEAVPLEPRRDANYADKFGMTDEEFAAAYGDELVYLNKRVLGAVRALQHAPGRRDPVIVIMSDHGYNYEVEDVQAMFGNLFAAFTPQEPGLLADAPTPVNLMPILFNRFLGTEFPISRDRYFLSTSVFQLLDLTEVGDPG